MGNPRPKQRPVTRITEIQGEPSQYRPHKKRKPVVEEIPPGKTLVTINSIYSDTGDRQEVRFLCDTVDLRIEDEFLELHNAFDPHAIIKRKLSARHITIKGVIRCP